MTKKNNLYASWVADMGAWTDVMGLVEQAGDPRSHVSSGANARMRSIAESRILDMYPEADVSTLTEDQIKGAYQLEQRDVGNRVAGTFDRNYRSIIGDLPDGALETLARVREVAANVADKDRPIVAAYSKFKGVEALIDTYKSAAQHDSVELPDDVREQLGRLAMRGAGIKETQRAAKMGYDSGMQALSAQLAESVVARGQIKDRKQLLELAKPGLSRELTDARISYNALVKKGKRDYHAAIKEAANAYVQRSVGSTREFVGAMQTIYSAAQGTLGQHSQN